MMSSNRSSASQSTAYSQSDLIWLDHCYAKPWSAHPDASNARPLRMLFMSKYPRKPAEKQARDTDLIDVDTVGETPPPPYDTSKANNLMNEFERNINFARTEEIGDQWEERIANLRSGWTPLQNRLFHKVIKALYSDRLARLTFENGPREPIQRRIHIDKAARRIRQALAGVLWDVRLTQWLHGILVENLSQQLLGPYLDILQVLRSKVPSLIDKMMAPHLSKCPAPAVEALNLLLKRPWDPASSLLHHSKLRKLPGNPLLLVIPSGPSGIMPVSGQSKRSKLWHSQLSSLGRVIQVAIHGSSVTSVAQCLENMIGAARTKVIELRGQHPNRPIVLIGWDVGALVANHVALLERVTAVVCLGFPLLSISGQRGDIDDMILDSKTPTLFVIGQFSETCRLDDLEDMREKMRADNSLLVVGGADGSLRMSRAKRKQEGVTQIMVDRAVQDELSEFLGGVIAHTSSPAGDQDSVADGETKRKQSSSSSSRKKKLSAANKSASVTSASGTPGSAPQKAAARNRASSLGHGEQLTTGADEESKNLSQSCDSKLLAQGLQGKKGQAKPSSSKRKKNSSGNASGSSAKRRAVSTTTAPENTPTASQVSQSTAGMPTVTPSTSTNLPSLPPASPLSQFLQTPPSVAALQAAMGLRGPAGLTPADLMAMQASLTSGLPTPESLASVMAAQSSLSASGLTTQASPSPALTTTASVKPTSLAEQLVQASAASLAATPSLAQQIAMTVTTLQEKLRAHTSSTSPAQVQTSGAPFPVPAMSQPSTLPVTTIAKLTPPATNIAPEKSVPLSPIKSALAAGPLPMRGPVSQYASSSASQIQTLLSNMVRQSNIVSAQQPVVSPQKPVVSIQQPVGPVQQMKGPLQQSPTQRPMVSPGASFPPSISPVMGPAAYAAAHTISPVQLLGLEAHQQLQYAASLAAISPPPGALARLPGVPLSSQHAALLAPKPIRPSSESPLVPPHMAAPRVILPPIAPTQPGTVRPTMVYPSTLHQIPRSALTASPISPALTAALSPVRPPLDPTQSPAPSEKEKILAIQKLQFHDFPLTTATISKTTGVAKITQAKILDQQLTLSKTPAQDQQQTPGNMSTLDKQSTLGKVPAHDQQSTSGNVPAQVQQPKPDNIPVQDQQPKISQPQAPDTQSTFGKSPAQNPQPTPGTLPVQNPQQTLGKMPAQHNQPILTKVPAQNQQPTIAKPPEQNQQATLGKPPPHDHQPILTKMPVQTQQPTLGKPPTQNPQPTVANMPVHFQQPTLVKALVQETQVTQQKVPPPVVKPTVSNVPEQQASSIKVLPEQHPSLGKVTVQSVPGKTQTAEQHRQHHHVLLGTGPSQVVKVSVSEPPVKTNIHSTQTGDAQTDSGPAAPDTIQRVVLPKGVVQRQTVKSVPQPKALEPLGQVQSVVDTSNKKTVLLSRVTTTKGSTTASGITVAPPPITMAASTITIPKATVVMSTTSSTALPSVSIAGDTKSCGGVSISTKGRSQGASTVISISTGPLTNMSGQSQSSRGPASEKTPDTGSRSTASSTPEAGASAKKTETTSTPTTTANSRSRRVKSKQ